MNRHQGWGTTHFRSREVALAYARSSITSPLGTAVSINAFGIKYALRLFRKDIFLSMYGFTFCVPKYGCKFFMIISSSQPCLVAIGII